MTIKFVYPVQASKIIYTYLHNVIYLIIYVGIYYIKTVISVNTFTYLI